MALDEQFKRLLLAANVLIENHMDLGDCFVSDDNEDDDYPTDSDGDRWYHDWWELREAIRGCESEEIGTTPAMPEITRQALDEVKIQQTGWTLNGRDTRLIPGDTVQQCGVNVLDYFDKHGKFLGPDENGLVPTFAETTSQKTAAAPDMLKALIQLTTEWERGREWISEDTIDQATRAIAKATSQQ
jgi:hypothetical protein